MKLKYILCALLVGSFLSPMPSYGQSVEKQKDKQKAKQIKSMETGGWDFEPGLYYYVMHKNYSGASLGWKWHGFESGPVANFDERKSSTKRTLTTRTLSAAQQDLKADIIEKERKLIEEVYKEEVYRNIDRNVDLEYDSYKSSFNRLQEGISGGLNYCLLKSKGKLKHLVDIVMSHNEICCQNIAYIHKTGVGYELENAKRRQAYEDALKDMHRIAKNTEYICFIAETYF